MLNPYTYIWGKIRCWLAPPSVQMWRCSIILCLVWKQRLSTLRLAFSHLAPWETALFTSCASLSDTPVRLWWASAISPSWAQIRDRRPGSRPLKQPWCCFWVRRRGRWERRRGRWERRRGRWERRRGSLLRYTHTLTRALTHIYTRAHTHTHSLTRNLWCSQPSSSSSSSLQTLIRVRLSSLISASSSFMQQTLVC